MQTDLWYDLVLRDLVGHDEVVRELLRDAEAAQGAPGAASDEPDVSGD